MIHASDSVPLSCTIFTFILLQTDIDAVCHAKAVCAQTHLCKCVVYASGGHSIEHLTAVRRTITTCALERLHGTSLLAGALSSFDSTHTLSTADTAANPALRP